MPAVFIELHQAIAGHVEVVLGGFVVWVLWVHKRKLKRIIHADTVECLEGFDDFTGLKRFIADVLPVQTGLYKLAYPENKSPPGWK